MKKFGFAIIVASGLSAAVLGLPVPALAVGVDHLDWLDQIHPKPMVPKVDNTVRHSGAR